MSTNYVKVSLTVTLKEAIKCMTDSQQKCLLVVDSEDLLEGILTVGDMKRYLSTASSDGDSTLADVCSLKFP